MRFSGRSATNYRAVILKVQPNRHGLAAASTRVILPIMLLMMTIPRPGISATTGRFWSYFNLASAVTPNWSFVIMPGIRYEFSRADNAPMSSNKELYFYELLTGPVYTKTWGRFTMKLPLWYYYMGFPSPGNYTYAHNIEFLPIFSYRSMKLALTSRTIFHNTIYASVYTASEQRKGYSLVIRQFLELAYDIDQRLSILLADEPFFGVIDDKQAPPSPIGFWPSGFRLNRLYAGFRYKITSRLAISPEYVLETVYDEDSVTDTNHYFFVTLNYTFRIF